MLLTVRPQVPADYPAIAALETAILNFPITPEDVARETTENPQFTGLVAEGDGQIIGRARAGFMHHHTPEGDQRCVVLVAPDERHKGAGEALWQALQAAVREYKPNHLRANGNPDDMESVRWAERRGFVQTHHHLFQQLDLSEFNPAPYAEKLTAVKDAGFRFVPFSELRSHENEERMWKLWFELIADTPDGQENEEPFETWRSWTLEGNRAWPEGWLVLVAPNGDWAGFTMMQQDSGGAHIYMTGLCRAYRGQGLAVPMKVAAVQWAQAHGLKHLTTLNHAANKPIVAVNRSLGYKVVEGVIRLVKRCEW